MGFYLNKKFSLIATVKTCTFNFDNNDNYEAFLKACGMGSMKRGFVTKLGGSITVSKISDTKYEFTVVNGPKSKTRQVSFGEQFEEDGMDGGKIRGAWVEEGGKLVGNFKNDKGNEFVFTRELIGGQLVQTMKAGSVVAKRFYNKK